MTNPVSKQRNSRDCPLRFWVLKVVVVTGALLPLPMVAREVSRRYLLQCEVSRCLLRDSMP